MMWSQTRKIIIFKPIILNTRDSISVELKKVFSRDSFILLLSFPDVGVFVRLGSRLVVVWTLSLKAITCQERTERPCEYPKATGKLKLHPSTEISIESFQFPPLASYLPRINGLYNEERNKGTERELQMKYTCPSYYLCCFHTLLELEAAPIQVEDQIR